MKRTSSKSKRRIVRLLSPPTSKTGLDEPAPAGLTVRALIHHQRFRSLRNRILMARTDDDHLLCIHNLVKLGYDYYG